MRPLSYVERRVLDLMLGVDFSGAAELRVQAESAESFGDATAAVPPLT